MTEQLRIGLVVSQWYPPIVDRLSEGAMTALAEAGIAADQIVKVEVPGSYEIPQGCKAVIERAQVDAVVTIGCVIRGETPHFELVCSECARGVTDVALQTNTPISLGVLTCDNREQAFARAGGDKGNKGQEAARAALQLVAAFKALIS